MTTATPASPIAERPPAPLVLRSEQDLLAYLTEWPWRWLGSRAEIRLRLPAIPHGAQQAVEKRLNFWRTVCGCLPGALIVLAALIWRGRIAIQTGNWTASIVLIELLYVLLLGIAGKLAAVAFARAALFLDAALLRRRLHACRACPGE